MVAVSIKECQGIEKNRVQPDLSALIYVFHAVKTKKVRIGLKKIISLSYGPLEKW